MRLSGLPLWDFERWQYGRWQATLTGKSRSSQAIEEDQGAVNEYILVARGPTLTVYANGTRLGTVSDSKLTDGQIAYTVFQDSGETTCTFKDTWIWALE